MKLEDVLFKVSISCNRGTAKERGEKFIKEIKKWAKGRVADKKNMMISNRSLRTFTTDYLKGWRDCQKKTIKNIEEG